MCVNVQSDLNHVWTSFTLAMVWPINVECTLTHCTQIDMYYAIILYLLPENLLQLLTYGLLFHSYLFRAALQYPVCHDGFLYTLYTAHWKKGIGTFGKMILYCILCQKTFLTVYCFTATFFVLRCCALYVMMVTLCSEMYYDIVLHFFPENLKKSKKKHIVAIQIITK